MFLYKFLIIFGLFATVLFSNEEIMPSHTTSSVQDVVQEFTEEDISQETLQEKPQEVTTLGQPPLENGGLPAEYYNISSTSKSKNYFFNYMYKLVEKENLNIFNERKIVLEFANQTILNWNFSSPNFKKYQSILKKYRVSYLYDVKELLKRVDIVPPSQALAQAAVESGWGKSRFIKEANNIFGHWTYTPKNGLMPLKRDEDATHFIRIFKSLQASVKAYMFNLNTNAAYYEFKEKRVELRRENKPLSGKILSQTMLKYSGIGHDYLEILDNLITSNDLERFDTKFFNKTKGL